MEDFFYKGIWRMDWGLGNPNTTAALIATLMVGVWALAWIRRWGFWTALVLFAGLGACLIHTFSRGGLIAVFAGLLPLILVAPRPWPWSRIIAVTTAVWIMIGFSLYLNAHERYGQGVIKEDRSITNRLELWKSAPPMIVDAPGGWGLGKAAKSYMLWYQSLDRNESYRTFVNSHLEWLIEFSWPLRFLYVFGWLAVFLLCWPRSAPPWFSVPLGIWLAFAVAAFFSSVAESPWVWIVPVLALTAVIGCRIFQKVWPKPILWALPVGLAVLVLASLFVMGRGAGEIQASPRQVLWGSGTPDVWLVADSRILGNSYGKTFRRYIQSSPSSFHTIGIVESTSNLEDVAGSRLIVSGKLSQDELAQLSGHLKKASAVTLLNPTFYPQELDLSPEDKEKIEVIFGEFSQNSTTEAWKSVCRFRLIEAAGDYFPGWTDILFTKAL